MADTPNSPAPEPPVEPANLQAAEPIVTAPSGASADLIARASQFNIDTSGFTSDKDLAGALFDLYEKERPYSEYGRQALATKQPEPQSEPPSAGSAEEPEAFDLDKHFSEAWKLPELSAGAQWALQHGAFTENEKGVIVAAPGLEQVALPYLREIQEHTQARASLTEEFQRNPVRFMYDKLIPALRHELRSDFESLDKETRTKSEAETFERNFISENKDWLFTPEGQLSPAGVKFQQAVEQLRAGGMSDPAALAKWGAMAAKPAAPVTATGAPAPETTLSELSGDGRPRGLDGKFVSKQASFLESAQRQSAASGSRNAPSDEDYKPANRGELDNIWVQAFQRQKAGAA